MDAASILNIITNSSLIVTRLISDVPIAFAQKLYEIKVAEDTQLGSILQLTLSTTTKDKIIFEITAGNEKKLFEVANGTGILILKKPLDFEIQNKHKLTVKAIAGKAYSETIVKVLVDDVNEFEPKFERERYETQITEEDDRHLPKKILKVTANDGDGGQFGDLTYALDILDDFVPTNETVFDIDPITSEISVFKALNRDHPDGYEKWILRITATDSINTATTTVTVNVKDINDNEPYFREKVYRASVAENSNAGTKVTTVRAYDSDSFPHGTDDRLTYSIGKNVIDEKTSKPIFSINSESGVVSTSICCLDREDVPQYTIQVVATDRGGLKGSSEVVIDVSDKNDELPRFEKNEWFFEALEAVPSGKIIASMKVIDKDISNKLAFRIVPGSGQGWYLFKIFGSRDGKKAFLTSQPLDYENAVHRRGFKFIVQVTDMGEDGWRFKNRVDAAWVKISVKDVNDNVPQFTNVTTFLPTTKIWKIFDNIKITLPEDIALETAVAKFSAVDSDQNQSRLLAEQELNHAKNGKIFFKISRNIDNFTTAEIGDNFKIGQDGVLKISSALDREKTHEQKVVVVAYDDDKTPLASSATVLITISDVNDNPPRIEQTEFWVTEEKTLQEIGKVYPVDVDDPTLGHGPPFTVRLASSASQFIRSAVEVVYNTVDNEIILRTKKSVDREQFKELLVPIFLSDSGNPARTATQTMTVKVADINDNPMQPAEKNVKVFTVQGVSTNCTEKISLGRVHVKDRDDWEATTKKYSLETSYNNSFVLDVDSGIIYMKSDVSEGRYTLKASVSDATHGQTNISSIINVDVARIPGEILGQAKEFVINMSPEELISKRNNKSESKLDQLEKYMNKEIDDWMSSKNRLNSDAIAFKMNLRDLQTKRTFFPANFFASKQFQVLSISRHFPDEIELWPHAAAFFSQSGRAFVTSSKEARGKKVVGSKIYAVAPDFFNLNQHVILNQMKIYRELAIYVANADRSYLDVSKDG